MINSYGLGRRIKRILRMEIMSEGQMVLWRRLKSERRT